MIRIRVFTTRVKEYVKNIPFKTYVTVLLEGIGLFANLIAVLTFLGALNTPTTSPNFYINSQEFFVWSLIAVVYMLGLISARFKRRWRWMIFEAGVEEKKYSFSQSVFFRSNLHWHMFVREFSFTLATIFPLTLLYVRAMQAAATDGTASPWTSLGITVLVWIPVTFGIMLASSIFDKALSLYSGD
jgi:hypothetical protein